MTKVGLIQIEFNVYNVFIFIFMKLILRKNILDQHIIEFESAKDRV